MTTPDATRPTNRGIEPTTGKSVYMSHGRTATKHHSAQNASRLITSGVEHMPCPVRAGVGHGLGRDRCDDPLRARNIMGTAFAPQATSRRAERLLRNADRSANSLP